MPDTNVASPAVAKPNPAVVARKTGQVKFFDSRKGFGFIKCDDGSRDVFMAINHLPKDCEVPMPDQRCSFIPTEGKKGPYAKDLQFS